VKKISTVLLILLIIVLPLFSVELEDSEIFLSTVIMEIPDYEFHLIELSPEPNYNYDASQAGVANFQINSNAVVNFASAPDLINIEITVGPWILVGETEASNFVSLISSTLSSSDDRVVINSLNNGFSVNFDSGYNSTFEIGTFSVGWSDKTNLDAGEYTSDVKISYTQI